ncbi:MAG: hypothetical protein EHM34_00350 [Nitrosopumilales archaeon]|nr:MAG: hypothetical protein EHM34_00350 [Nitrosopumilales archaeon]
MTNLSQFTKAELLKMANQLCKHKHTYLEHPNCYLKERKIELKIGYFDIESGGLNANFDYMLTWCIKTGGKEEYKEGVITQGEILEYSFDKGIIKELIKALKEYDVIVTYYGTKFDIPFIRTRAMTHKLKFLSFGAVQHKDVYYMVKGRMRLGRSSLDSACAALGIKGKNHIKGNFWMRAKVGDPTALAYVLDHNRKDCQILEKLHLRILEYVKDQSRSI